MATRTAAKTAKTAATTQVKTDDHIIMSMTPAGFEAPFDTQAGAFLLDVMDIYPNPDQPRTEFDLGKIKLLAKSIKSETQLQPISVLYKPHEDGEDFGRFMILDGERRWRAVQEIRQRTIKAVFGAAGNEVDVFLRAMLANNQREAMSPMDQARAYYKLHVTYGLTIDEIAERAGLNDDEKFSIPWRLKLMNLSPECTEAFEKGWVTGVNPRGREQRKQLNNTQARILGEVLNPDGSPNYEKQNELLQMIKDGKIRTDSAIKAARTLIMNPTQAVQTELDTILPMSETTQKKINGLVQLIAKAASLMTEIEQSQAEGSDKRCVDALPPGEADNLLKQIQFITSNATTLRKMIEPRAVAVVLGGANEMTTKTKRGSRAAAKS